jgi:type II secretory pathway pseudopilin PulG
MIASGILARVRRYWAGRTGAFTLIELLVTVVMAGIIFAALIPLFTNVLKTDSRDTRRVVATNIAQQQIEDIRLLAASPAGYASLTNADLNSSTWNPTLIHTSYTPPAGGQPYGISTSVSDDSSTAAFKNISVTVQRPGDGFQTIVRTTVQNPNAVTISTMSGPTGGNGPFSLTAAFKNYTEVSSKGVYVVYVNMTPTPHVTTTATPALQVPTPSSTTCTWTNLPGGMNYLYTVYCNSSSASLSFCNGLEASPQFHLLSNAWLKFDTNPGGS